MPGFWILVLQLSKDSNPGHTKSPSSTKSSAWFTTIRRNIELFCSVQRWWLWVEQTRCSKAFGPQFMSLGVYICPGERIKCSCASRSSRIFSPSSKLILDGPATTSILFTFERSSMWIISCTTGTSRESAPVEFSLHKAHKKACPTCFVPMHLNMNKLTPSLLSSTTSKMFHNSIQESLLMTIWHTNDYLSATIDRFYQ